MLKNIFLVALLSIVAFAKFISIDEHQVQDMIKKGVPVIDVRRVEEWKQRGIINTAHPLTFFDKDGRYDAMKWLSAFSKIVKSKNQPFIIYCAHGNRTKAIGQFLDQVGYKHIYDLKGGLEYGWIAKGLKTIRYMGN